MRQASLAPILRIFRRHRGRCCWILLLHLVAFFPLFILLLLVYSPRCVWYADMEELSWLLTFKAHGFHEMRRNSQGTFECRLRVCVYMHEICCALQPVANCILNSSAQSRERERDRAALIEFVGINKITHVHALVKTLKRPTHLSSFE